MNPDFHSYDSIFEIIQSKVNEELRGKSRHRDNNSDSDQDSADDDLGWEFEENVKADAEELLEFRTDLEAEGSSYKKLLSNFSARVREKSLIPLAQTDQDLSNLFYKELEKAEFFVAIQEKYIQKSRMYIEKNQNMDMGEFFNEILREYSNMIKKN